MVNIQPQILFFINLRDQYIAQRKKQPENEPRRYGLSDPEGIKLTTMASKIVVTLSVGLDILSESCAQKQLLLSQIHQSL